MQYLKLLYKYLRNQKGKVFFLFIFVMISSVIDLILPSILSDFIDSSLAGDGKDKLLFLAFKYLILTLSNIGVAILITYMSQVIGWRATNTLREDLVKHSMGLDIAYFKDKLKGELIEVIDGDVNSLFNFFSRMGVVLLSNSMILLGVLFIYFRKDMKMGIIQVIFSILVFMAFIKLKQRGVALRKKERTYVGKMVSFFGETLENTEDIHGNGGKHYIFERFDETLREWLPVSIKANITGWSMFMLLLGLQAIGYAITFIFGTILWKSGIITIGTIYLFYNYTQYIIDPINMFQREMQELQRVGAGIARIDSLLKEEPTIPDTEETYEIQKEDGISFEHVSFSYDSDREILKDINFTIQPGHTIGLLGRTGSGKTTIAGLLARFYDVGSGVIRIGQKNIKGIGLKSLRQQIVYVTQNIQILDATIRDNITFFDTSISDETIRNAIDSMGLADWFSKFEDGLDTKLGTDGVGLSAGEAQLVACIRAFIKQPKIVILDEISSKLDLETERKINIAIQKLLQDKIGIIIAHRLQTVEQVDEIIILDHGKIVEEGKTEVLKNDNKSRFHQLLISAGKGEVVYE